MGGVYKKIRKICVTKKKISSKLKIFFLKNQFFANFSKQIVFFYVKFAFRMFSAFIWCTYCPCRSKMTNFQKLWYRKLENFRGQSRLLRHHLTAKLFNLQWWKNQIEHHIAKNRKISCCSVKTLDWKMIDTSFESPKCEL